MEKLNVKNKQIVERSIPVVKRARTKNLAFIFNLAAHGVLLKIEK